MPFNRSWSEVIPVILLSIRSTWREDFPATAAELVYGRQPLRPGEFLKHHPNENLPQPPDLVQDLREFFQALQPQPVARHSQEKPFVFKGLYKTSYVFVRCDCTKSALQKSYHGPYLVLRRGDKTFTICVKGKEIVVSTNRLKEEDHCCSREQTPRYEKTPLRSSQSPTAHHEIRSTYSFPTPFPGMSFVILITTRECCGINALSYIFFYK